MSLTQIRPATSWQSLGFGPLTVQVLSGTLVLEAGDRRPADNAAGTIVNACVGAEPSRLAAGTEWWAKALVVNTAINVLAGLATAADEAANAALSNRAADGQAVAGLDLSATTLVVACSDGTLRPASASDPNQFGLVAGFTIIDALAGTAVPVTRNDTLTNAAWTLRPGPVYLGENGAPTQTEPTAGFVQVVGLALSPTTIMAGFWPPTLL